MLFLFSMGFTFLIAIEQHLTQESVNVEDFVHEITSKNRKFLCELITSLTFPEMTVRFKVRKFVIIIIV